MRVFILLGVLGFAAGTAGAQVAAPTPSRAAVIAAATDIIQKARYCTFITIDSTGQPQARIVDPIAPGADFVVWFATNPRSRKVGQVEANAKVTLSCFDTASSSYVTLLGRASLVRDVSEKQRHWKKDWAAIYPNGPTGDDVVLIRVTPGRLEIVSESRGIMSDPKTWSPTAIDFPQKPLK
jgi:general stress protein 26